jgi:hypothetical protein
MHFTLLKTLSLLLARAGAALRRPKAARSGVVDAK